MNNRSYILGFVFGMVLVAIVCFVLHLIKREKRSDYDERQEAVRGKGFKLAYFTALFTLLLGGIAECILDAAWCGLFTLAMVAVWTSISVFTTYCVIKDAYFTLRSKRRLLIAIFCFAGAVNLFIGIRSIAAGELIEGGMLSLYASNLLTGTCCLYLGAMMLCRSLWERRREDTE